MSMIRLTRRLGLLSSLAVGLLAWTGCESPARRLDPKAVETIKPGVTTRQEVLRDFGTPRATITENDRTVLVYQRNHPGWHNSYGPMQRGSITAFSVLIDRDDRVQRKLYSVHNVHLYFGAGSVMAGAPVNDKLIARIQSGRTTRQEALAILGEPALEYLSVSGGVVVGWFFYEANVAGGRHLRELQLLFDGAEVVRAMKTLNVP